jgi:putative ABC transport system permease protein
MDTLLQDLRHAARSLRRAPAFTAAAVLTLALGIGANAAIFSVVDGVLLRPAPFPDVDRLMMVWETDRNSGTAREPASIPDFRDFAQRASQFSALAAFTPAEVSLTRRGSEPSRLAALAVTEGFVPLLGLQPIAGRLFSPEETRDGGPRSVLISEDLWDSRFARAPEIVGTTIRLDDVDWRIVGVLPRSADFGTLQTLGRAAYGRGFADRGDRARVDVWFGLRASAEASRDNHPIFVAGRLANGATPGSAQEEMTAIAAELERAYPSNRGRGVHVEPMTSVIFGKTRPAMLVLLGAVALVLLVACGNVANLLLVRGAGRTREVSVRIALGAGRRRLAVQFLSESALLTALGAVLGILLAYVGLDLLLAMAPSSLPRVDAVGLDIRVLGVTLAVCVLVSLLFGSVPLLQSRERNLHRALQSASGRGASAGRTQRRVRSALVVAELAMAVMLMSGAGLLITSLWQLQRVDPGFNAAGVLKAEFQLPASRYPQDRSSFPDWPAHRRFYAELQARVAALPGVQGVAVAAANPLDAGFTSSIRVVGREGEAADWPEPSIRSVSASYFATMGVPLADGRVFGSSDDANAAPVIMINESARQRYFGGARALGQRISLWGAHRTVVGIVGNEHVKGIDEAAPPAVYLPLPQAPTGNAVLLRVTGDPSSFAPAIRRIVAALDPALPLFGVEPLQQTLSNSLAERRFTMVSLGAFAAVALLLAAIGVHGVLSYTVAQRTREIGIRMALGADARGVRALIMSEGAVLAGIGLAIGLAGAFAMTGALSVLLYGVGARDPMVFAAVAIGLGVVALAASYLPANRAARLDPIAALRME